MAEKSERRGIAWRQARVGALIVVSALALGYGMFRVGKVFDVFASRYELVTFVPSALGLREGAPVTLAGQRIGQVKTIDFIPVEKKTGGNNLRIVLALSNDVREQIRRDSRAFLRTQGLLGDKFVDIEPGTAGSAILAAGETLPAGESLDIDQFMMQASKALEQATGIITNLQDITGGITRGEGSVGLMLQDEALYRSMTATTQELALTLGSINRADGTFGRFIRDPALYQRLNAAVARMDSLGALVLNGNGSIGKLLRTDSLYRGIAHTLGTADSAVVGLNAMLQKFSTGNGTIQKFMTDPQMYDELLKSIIDVQTLINDVRKNPKRFMPNIMVDIF
jgi:phospholipid/cholesterol/gamma-HCH transport system substrate-binding protein